ncbi:hypothetical protein RCO48_05545 [Peribacillus frigoritolerans]|nr:hypothetical protein [Peribacillus frigoritolerans]
MALILERKSTVVVHQEESDFTLPMRIGVGYHNTEVQDWHYENPTVIEFIDLEHFLELYQEKRRKTRYKVAGCDGFPQCS